MKKSKFLVYWSLLAFLSAALFWPAISELIVFWWENPDYSHCFLIPPASAYLIWRSKKELNNASLKTSFIGLMALLAGLFLYLAGYAGGILIFQRLALVVVINGIVLFNCGPRLYRMMAFPLLFLFLIIPIPVTVQGLIAFPMQLFATDAAHAVLLKISVPVVRAGNILHFPQGALEVIEACSGIRSLLSYFTIAVFFAYWNKERWINRVILILSTLPIAMGANILRISLSGLMGYVYGMDLARGFMHDFSGFVLFSLGLVVFMVEAHVLNRVFHQKGRP